MNDEFVTLREHEEFVRRMDEANSRQSRRISIIEENVREITALTASVQKLAVSMENMAREQERQGKKLETLEGRDGEMWRKVVGYVVTAVAGILLGFVFTRLGM